MRRGSQGVTWASLLVAMGEFRFRVWVIGFMLESLPSERSLWKVARFVIPHCPVYQMKNHP